MDEYLRRPLHNSSSPRDKEPKELDKLVKWQQERMERRLRGEYESAIMHLSEVINDNIKSRVNISSVRVEGAPNTRRSFLAGIIDPAVSSCETLEDALHATRRISHSLQKTDIFSSIEASIDRPKDNAFAQTGDVDLVFKTRERGRWFVSSSTEVGNNEGTASASARIRNVFGGAETFTANMSLGTKTKRAFTASLVSPLTPKMKEFAEVQVYGMERDLTQHASCFEGLRGMKAVLRTGQPSWGAHELAYDAVARHIASLTPTASIRSDLDFKPYPYTYLLTRRSSIRNAAGPSFKSAVSYNFVLDTRDDRVYPSRGSYFKLATELAGAGPLRGDSRHIKGELEAGAGRRVVEGVALNLTARAGLLYGLNGSQTKFSDRFQLGGPTNVRSFRMNGMGPRDGDDSIGGDLYYSTGFSLVSHIPSKPEWPVKTHLWVNAGRLDSINQDKPLKETIREALLRPAFSAGMGLIYQFNPVRVEVNFGVPLAASSSDAMRRGIQVGMGLEFL
ncbi:hypothetical protein D9619_010794 [Psilocybe cf. subviscida]|uniref:Bacterial surface antigen (D15) domain-containing protein n=1 Tax=Psilocybe cf. subviscida TaxID=2480587 RepID=A0A8H5EZY5_9AGAR|nr:hypothetical protein D9619_010794 [Psilocybe cf. subviscida]